MYFTYIGDLEHIKSNVRVSPLLKLSRMARKFTTFIDTILGNNNNWEA